jgi:hexosaminidase
MSWRGMDGGIAAAKMNHPVVMSPTGFVYLDYYQGDPALEPTTFGRLLLSTVYKFEPEPEGVGAKYILGGQGNLWTESVPNARHAEYMTWPRAFALAETLWSPKTTRNWADFMRRTEAQFQRLDNAQVNYARSVYDVAITPARDSSGKLTLRMSSEIGGTDIYYTIDGTNPDSFLLKYPGASVTVPEEVYVVKAVAWRNGKPSGRVVSILMRELIARLPRPRS